jgi:hypothetical protein
MEEAAVVTLRKTRPMVDEESQEGTKLMTTMMTMTMIDFEKREGASRRALR